MEPKQTRILPHWYEYKIGGLNVDDEEIENIFAKCDEFVLYIIKNNVVVTYEVIEHLCPNYKIIAALMKPISTQANEILSKSKYKYFRSILVSDLIRLFDTKEILKVNEIQFESKNFLDVRIHDINHFRYVASAFAFTLLTLLPPLIYLYFAESKDEIYHILNGSFFGSVGAFVSILQRYKSIIIPKYSTWRFTFLGALSKVALGSIFGGLFVILNKSGLLLNIVNSSIFLVYTLSFVSGFSERFFPDLLEKTVNQLKTKEKSESAG